MPRQVSNLHPPDSESGDFTHSSTRQWLRVFSSNQGSRWEWQDSNLRLQGFKLVLQPSQLHSRIGLSDDFWGALRSKKLSNPFSFSSPLCKSDSQKAEGRGIEPPACYTALVFKTSCRPFSGAFQNLVTQIWGAIAPTEREGFEPSAAVNPPLLLSRKAL